MKSLKNYKRIISLVLSISIASSVLTPSFAQAGFFDRVKDRVKTFSKNVVKEFKEKPFKLALKCLVPMIPILVGVPLLVSSRGKNVSPINAGSVSPIMESVSPTNLISALPVISPTNLISALPAILPTNLVSSALPVNLENISPVIEAVIPKIETAIPTAMSNAMPSVVNAAPAVSSLFAKIIEKAKPVGNALLSAGKFAGNVAVGTGKFLGKVAYGAGKIGVNAAVGTGKFLGKTAYGIGKFGVNAAIGTGKALIVTPINYAIVKPTKFVYNNLSDGYFGVFSSIGSATRGITGFNIRNVGRVAAISTIIAVFAAAAVAATAAAGFVGYKYGLRPLVKKHGGNQPDAPRAPIEPKEVMPKFRECLVNLKAACSHLKGSLLHLSRNEMTAGYGKLKDGCGNLLEGAKNGFTNVKNVLVDFFDPRWSDFKNDAKGAINPIVRGILPERANQVVERVEGVVERVREARTGLVQNILLPVEERHENPAGNNRPLVGNGPSEVVHLDGGVEAVVGNHHNGAPNGVVNAGPGPELNQHNVVNADPGILGAMEIRAKFELARGIEYFDGKNGQNGAENLVLERPNVVGPRNQEGTGTDNLVIERPIVRNGSRNRVIGVEDTETSVVGGNSNENKPRFYLDDLKRADIKNKIAKELELTEKDLAGLKADFERLSRAEKSGVKVDRNRGVVSLGGELAVKAFKYGTNQGFVVAQTALLDKIDSYMGAGLTKRGGEVASWGSALCAGAGAGTVASLVFGLPVSIITALAVTGGAGFWLRSNKCLRDKEEKPRDLCNSDHKGKLAISGCAGVVGGLAVAGTGLISIVGSPIMLWHAAEFGPWVVCKAFVTTAYGVTVFIMKWGTLTGLTLTGTVAVLGCTYMLYKKPDYLINPVLNAFKPAGETYQKMISGEKVKRVVGCLVSVKNGLKQELEWKNSGSVVAGTAIGSASVGIGYYGIKAAYEKLASLFQGVKLNPVCPVNANNLFVQSPANNLVCPAISTNSTMPAGNGPAGWFNISFGDVATPFAIVMGTAGLLLLVDKKIINPLDKKITSLAREHANVVRHDGMNSLFNDPANKEWMDNFERERKEREDELLSESKRVFLAEVKAPKVTKTFWDYVPFAKESAKLFAAAKENLFKPVFNHAVIAKDSLIEVFKEGKKQLFSKGKASKKGLNEETDYIKAVKKEKEEKEAREKDWELYIRDQKKDDLADVIEEQPKPVLKGWVGSGFGALNTGIRYVRRTKLPKPVVKGVGFCLEKGFGALNFCIRKFKSGVSNVKKIVKNVNDMNDELLEEHCLN